MMAGIEVIEWVFVDGEPSDILSCQICTNVFDDPQLTSCCGECYCKKCITNYWQSMQIKTRTCPKCRATEFEMLSNTALENSISKLKVQCPMKESGCEFIGTIKDTNCHLELECVFKQIQCPNKCNAPMFQRSQLANHVEKCSLEMVKCPFTVVGCGAKPQPRKDIVAHELSQVHEHLLSIVEHNNKSAIKSQTLMKSLQDEQKQALRERSALVTDLKEKLETAESALATLDAKLQATQMKLLTMKDEKQKTSASYDNYSGLNRQRAGGIKEIHTAVAEQVYALPFPTESKGILPIPVTLTIDRFSERQSYDYDWISPPFYSHNGGYKLCLSVNTNGHGEAHGDHISVFIHVMAGEFDDKLEWPMPDCIVTIVAMNQRNVVTSLVLGTYGSSHHDIWLASENSIKMRSRVFDGTYGEGWGIHKFILHSHIGQYLTNDEFTIKVYSIQFLPF